MALKKVYHEPRGNGGPVFGARLRSSSHLPAHSVSLFSTTFRSCKAPAPGSHHVDVPLVTGAVAGVQAKPQPEARNQRVWAKKPKFN